MYVVWSRDNYLKKGPTPLYSLLAMRLLISKKKALTKVTNVKFVVAFRADTHSPLLGYYVTTLRYSYRYQRPRPSRFAK
jgi:hypothetical protein